MRAPSLQARRYYMGGLALAVMGAVFFSAKAIVAKLLYRHGIDPFMAGKFLRRAEFDAIWDDFVALAARLGLHGTEYVVGWTAWLDLTPVGVSKASGLEWVARELGFDRVAWGSGGHNRRTCRRGCRLRRWRSYAMLWLQVDSARMRRRRRWSSRAANRISKPSPASPPPTAPASSRPIVPSACRASCAAPPP